VALLSSIGLSVTGLSPAGLSLAAQSLARQRLAGPSGLSVTGPAWPSVTGLVRHPAGERAAAGR
jgi:hypothetical protein